MIMSKVTHPPRLADASLLVIESLNALKTHEEPGYIILVQEELDEHLILHMIINQVLVKVSLPQINLMGLMVQKIDIIGHLIGIQKKLMPYNAYKFHETKIEEILTPVSC